MCKGWDLENMSGNGAASGAPWLESRDNVWCGVRGEGPGVLAEMLQVPANVSPLWQCDSASPDSV